MILCHRVELSYYTFLGLSRIHVVIVHVFLEGPVTSYGSFGEAEKHQHLVGLGQVA
jgi:hypothetical protein